VLELGGTWRAAVADEDLRRRFADPDEDDDGWEPIRVPGHWQSAPAFASTDGPLLHRRRFAAARPDPGERAWLTLEGLFYQGDVWLDGEYLGATEGYFVRHSFEVTDALRARAEHLLAVEVTCDPERDRTAKRNLTGVFQHWDCLDPDRNPGGIWRPVHIERTGPVRARSLSLRCTEATEDRAVVAFRADLDSDAARTATITTTVGGHVDRAEHDLAAGSNTVEWAVTIPDPQRWWPAALGDPVLHDVTVDVDGSHVLARRTGLRTVSMKRWVVAVNDERLFLKGANAGPTRQALGEASPEELRRDVDLAREAGLDLLRVHAHISRPELYEAADEAGLLVWQDLPLQWGYARGTRPSAVRQARAAVEQLGHHPSIAVWCGHNEPLALDLEPGGDMAKAAMAFMGGQQLPSWNKSVLDRALKRALARADGSRPVIPHSGVLPHVGGGGTDTHVYFGWYHGDERQFAGFCRAVPRLARFVSEFGAQAVPEAAAFMEPDRWPDLDWDRLGRSSALQKAVFDRHVPPADFATFDEWREATQAYQAELIKGHVEVLRRLKYRPTGGFCHFSLVDALDHPAVTWSVVDAERRPKTGFRALTAACRPVLVTADRPPPTVRPEQALALDVHVVNDLRTSLEAVVVEAVASWPGGRHGWRWQGEVGPDAVALVGTIQLVVPDAEGPLELALRLHHPEASSDNAYRAAISR
jgi:beta-mannosidase